MLSILMLEIQFFLLIVLKKVVFFVSIMSLVKSHFNNLKSIIILFVKSGFKTSLAQR